MNFTSCIFLSTLDSIGDRLGRGLIWQFKNVTNGLGKYTKPRHLTNLNVTYSVQAVFLHFSNLGYISVTPRNNNNNKEKKGEEDVNKWKKK